MEPIFIDEEEAVEVLSNVFFPPIQFPHSATGEGKRKSGGAWLMVIGGGSR